MARIGLDLDGVVYKFTLAFQKHVAKCKPELFSGDVNKEADVWDWFTGWGMSRDAFLAEMDCAVGNLDLFWNGELYENDIPKQIRRLQDADHTVHVVTHRFSKKLPFTAEEGTRYWLPNRGIFPDSITFAKDKTSVPTDFFLEDNLDNYFALDRAGVRSILIDRPYNQEHPSNWRVERVQTFGEFVDIVLEA